jgi:hypothetical protein
LKVEGKYKYSHKLHAARNTASSYTPQAASNTVEG